MDHDQARRLINQQFEEGPLAPHQAQALRIHLRDCEACKAYYDRLADLESLLHNDSAPAPMLQRLLAAGPPEPRAASPQSRIRWAQVIGPALAIAAGIIGLSLFTQTKPGPAHPAYTLSLVGGERTLRSSAPSDATPRFAPESQIELILRPEEPHSEKTTAQAFLLQAKTVHPTSISWTRADNGVLLAEGTARALFGQPEPGRWTLVIRMGRPDRLAEAGPPSIGATPTGLQQLEHPIQIEPVK